MHSIMSECLACTKFVSFYLYFSIRHIPKAKATAIADTPELKRIAENTKIQSNAKYHADFEKQKGKFTQVRFIFCVVIKSLLSFINTITVTNF